MVSMDYWLNERQDGLYEFSTAMPLGPAPSEPRIIKVSGPTLAKPPKGALTQAQVQAWADELERKGYAVSSRRFGE